MIPHGVDIFVATESIDLRWGFERLCGLAQVRMGRQARCGALFVFFGKKRHAMKILFFDGSGLCLFYKRLDKNIFLFPEKFDQSATCIEINERELDDMLDGITIEKPKQKESKIRAH